MSGYFSDTRVAAHGWSRRPPIDEDDDTDDRDADTLDVHTFPEDDADDDWDDAAAFAATTAAMPPDDDGTVRTFGEDARLVVSDDADDDGTVPGEFITVDNSDITVTTADGTSTVNPFTGEFTVTMSDDTDDEDWGIRGVPPCPECEVQDAVQLSTGEYVCQVSDCHEVYEP